MAAWLTGFEWRTEFPVAKKEQRGGRCCWPSAALSFACCGIMPANGWSGSCL